jgi:acyl-coenzyme A thioesterase PaaI-like protein
VTPSHRSFPSLPGATEHAADGADLHDRRQAIGELGEALRTLIEQATATEAPPADLRRCAAQLRTAAATLATHTRTRWVMPGADDLLAGIRMYNPVSGTGSGLAPPVHIDLVDGRAVGTCTLGLAYEGPPTYAHGGISALLMDQMLGYAVGATGRPGLTVALDIRYQAPVPLHTPLRLDARVTETSGRRITATGSIVTADDPHTPLVQATATFVALRPSQLADLFGAALHPDTSQPEEPPR